MILSFVGRGAEKEGGGREGIACVIDAPIHIRSVAILSCSLRDARGTRTKLGEGEQGWCDGAEGEGGDREADMQNVSGLL